MWNYFSSLPHKAKLACLYNPFLIYKEDVNYVRACLLESLVANI